MSELTLFWPLYTLPALEFLCFCWCTGTGACCWFHRHWFTIVERSRVTIHCPIPLASLAGNPVRIAASRLTTRPFKWLDRPAASAPLQPQHAIRCPGGGSSWWRPFLFSPLLVPTNRISFINTHTLLPPEPSPSGVRKCAAFTWLSTLIPPIVSFLFTRHLVARNVNFETQRCQFECQIVEMQRRHRVTCFNRFILGTFSVYLEHFQLFGTDVAAQKKKKLQPCA